jgi:hypothetical protein
MKPKATSPVVIFFSKRLTRFGGDAKTPSEALISFLEETGYKLLVGK